MNVSAPESVYVDIEQFNNMNNHINHKNTMNDYVRLQMCGLNSDDQQVFVRPQLLNH